MDQFNNIIIRSITAVIIAPIFIYIIYLNNFFFTSLMFFLFIISLYELKFLIKNNFFFYINLAIIFLIFIFCFQNLRGETFEDFIYLSWFILIVWLSDIGGLIFGKLIGGKKLTKWSPNKTWSGLYGSLFLSQLSFFLTINIFIKINFSIKIFFFQIFLTLISIIGDLFFSIIKRKFLIKDFSSIIPGHGGLLDRIDGLIFVIIISNLFKYINAY